MEKTLDKGVFNLSDAPNDRKPLKTVTGPGSFYYWVHNLQITLFMELITKNKYRGKRLINEFNSRRYTDQPMLTYAEIMNVFKAWLPEFKEFLLRELEDVEDKLAQESDKELNWNRIESYKLSNKQKYELRLILGPMKVALCGENFPEWINDTRHRGQPQLEDHEMYHVYKSFLIDFKEKIDKKIEENILKGIEKIEIK